MLVEEKVRRLGIDDCRELSYVDVLARTYDEGIKALISMGPWDELYLDHDLNALKSSYGGDGFREMTGYDIVCFIEQYPQYRPKKVVLVTSNPAGRVKMVQALKRIYGEDFQ